MCTRLLLFVCVGTFRVPQYSPDYVAGASHPGLFRPMFVGKQQGADSLCSAPLISFAGHFLPVRRLPVRPSLLPITLRVRGTNLVEVALRFMASKQARSL